MCSTVMAAPSLCMPPLICMTQPGQSITTSEAMEEDVTQDVSFMSVPVGRGAGNHDALGVDHLAHDADLLRRDLLQAAEQHVGRGVRAGQRHAQPAQQGCRRMDTSEPFEQRLGPEVG